MKTKEKLVRDYIPSIIEATGKRPIVRQAVGTERARLLMQKLEEEVGEFSESRSIEELADILEVIHTLAAQMGVTFEAVDLKRSQKRLERGGFERFLVLVDVQAR